MNSFIPLKMSFTEYAGDDRDYRDNRIGRLSRMARLSPSLKLTSFFAIYATALAITAGSHCCF